MPKRIDHVIVAAADLDHLEANFTRLGFRVVGGGRHPHLGTRNRIILLGEGYIELLAIADEQVVSPAVRERITRAPGWIGFALQSDDIGEESVEMHARGADVRGPKPGRLVGPSDNVRTWQTVTVGRDDLFSSAEPIPFLIQHDSSGERHQRELAGTDPIEPHPNGAIRLGSVVVAIDSLPDAMHSFAQTYALAPVGPKQTNSSLNVDSVTLPLPADDERIVLAEPLGAGIIADRLANAGEGVCYASVIVDNPDATHDYLRNQGVTAERWGDGSLFIPPVATGGAPLIFLSNTSENNSL